jgi:hypothetical protein
MGQVDVKGSTGIDQQKLQMIIKTINNKEAMYNKKINKKIKNIFD